MLLNESQLRTLRAAIYRIVPAGRAPAASQLNVADFIVDLISDGAIDAEMYRQGLSALDGEAQAVAGTAFDFLEDELQDEILASVENGNVVTRWSIVPGRFLRSLVQHTMEGYYDARSTRLALMESAWPAIGIDFRG